MQERIKTRVACFCNLKAALIYMVILGHVIEDMAKTQPMLMDLYRAIYAVHMPLFAYLCGVCSQDASTCLRKAKEGFMLYVLLQTAAWLVSTPFGAGLDPLTPWWHTWFLLSMTCWRMLAALWHALGKRLACLNAAWIRAGLVMICMLLVCAAGHWRVVGRVLSLSRTIVFLPYFLIGLFLPGHIDWRRYRDLGEIALAAALGGLYLLGDALPAEFLYQAEGYAALGAAHGGFLRLACYGLGMVGGFAILSLVPARRTRFTRFGVDTLPVYLAHAPLAFLLRQAPLPMPWFALAAPVMAAALYYLLYRIFCDARISCRLTDIHGRPLGEIAPLWMRWI